MIYVPYYQESFSDNYIRTRKTIFDPISNICSLCLTIYNVFIFIFCGFYSNNFDNYKIIEKILLQNKKSYLKSEDTNKNEEILELLSDFDKKDKNEILLKTNSSVKEKNKIIEKKEDISDDEFQDKISDDEESRTLPKLHFYDFLFNNIYCNNNCCLFNKQEIITKCKNIITKYYSIEYIVYSLMKLENLFKDYKWNNSELNTIENNKYLNELQSII